MIPKKIWQTYKDPYDQLPDYIKETSETWKEINPEYDYEYMDDSQAREFVKNFYGNDMVELFDSVPVGVMRGDMWRYLIIYAYGGVYTDLDTKCLKPISTWMKEDKSLIICPEHDIHLCQWTFAAEAGHPSIKSVIDLMVKRLSDNPDWEIPHFVHYYTGPGVWTEGIISSLNVSKKNSIIDESIEWNNLDRAKELGFFCYGGEDWRIFHLTASQHLYGSQNWHHGYEQWINNPLSEKSRKQALSE